MVSLHPNKNSETKQWAQALEEKLLPEEPFERSIGLSLIIPVYNCSEVIGATLESVSKQDYEPLEVIIIDAGSTDRTLEIVNSYAVLISRIYTVSHFNMTDMINRGILLASHHYLSILFPGSFYLSPLCYQTFAKSVVEHHFPDVVYCGSIQREVKTEPRYLHFPFDKNRIAKGKHPATLPACWFRRELFEEIGKFDTRFTLRLGYEFFCKIACQKEITVHMIDRLFVDFDYGRFSYGKILRYATETWRIILAHFGFKSALLWFLSINHLVLIKWMWRHFRKSLFS